MSIAQNKRSDKLPAISYTHLCCDGPQHHNTSVGKYDLNISVPTA